jgi:hypothetical protein
MEIEKATKKERLMATSLLTAIERATLTETEKETGLRTETAKD